MKNRDSIRFGSGFHDSDSRPVLFFGSSSRVRFYVRFKWFHSVPLFGSSGRFGFESKTGTDSEKNGFGASLFTKGAFTVYDRNQSVLVCATPITSLFQDLEG